MSIGIITQVTDKIKSDFGASSRTDGLSKDFCERSQWSSKFKVGDIATDGSFSCRPIVRIECLEDSFVYHFEGVVRGCSEHTLLHPDESNQPLMPLSPPISTAKYKPGDVATVLIGSYLFACRRIVRIERLPDSAFHYVFCGITGAFCESDVVLAEDTTPKMPHWDGVPCSLCSFRETKCCTGDIANAKYKAGDIATVQINGDSLFPPGMIVKIESNDGAFHYFFEGHQCGYREEDVVLAKIPPCPPLTRQKLTLATLHSTETLHDCALSSDFDTNDTAKSSPSVPPQNYDKQHYQPADCHSSSDIYSIQLPDSTRIVFYPEYESNKHWQNPPQYLDDFPDKADARTVDFGVPLDEQGDLPVPDEPSEDLLVAHAKRLALNYQHDGNSFGPQKSSLPQPTAPAPVASTRKPATKKQIRFGAKFSLDLSGSTCVEASLAIEKAMAEFGPPATDNQKTYLERYGVDTTNISFDEAKAAIEEIGVWREGLAAEIHSELDGRRSANGWYRCECVFCPPSKSSNGTPKRNMGYTIETGSDFDEIGFVCHKCGEKGGTLDLANELGFSYRGVISFSKKKKVPVVPKPEVKEEPLWKQSPRQYQIDLANLRDLNSRWQGYKPLLPETIKRFGLGYGTPPDGFYGPGLIIPVTENGEIVGFRCRHTTGELKNQWRTVTGSKTTLFNSDLVTEGCIVVVTENNVDSLLMMQEIPEIDGIPVVGVSSSSGVWSWRKEWSKTLARARLVVMATDNDHAGQPSEEYQVLLESEHQLKTDARAAEGASQPPLRLPGGFKAYRSLLKAGANVVVFPWAVNKMDVGDYLTGVIANKALSEGPICEQWSVHAGRAGKEEAAYEERFGFLNEESVFHDFLARHSELNVRECEYVRPRLWLDSSADAHSPSVTGTIHNRATIERISVAELRRRRKNDAQRTAAPEPELDTADKAHHGRSVTGTIYNRATIERIPITELRRRRKNDAQRRAPSHKSSSSLDTFPCADEGLPVDSADFVLDPEYESCKSWQNPPQYLDDFPDKADSRPVNFGDGKQLDVPAPVPVEPLKDGLCEFGSRLALNYQHYGNSFGPQKSIDLCGELIYWANLGARFTRLKNEHDAPHYKEPKQARKQPMGKNWQNRPHSAAQAQEHLDTGRGIGLLCGAYSNGIICLEIDELGVEKALSACPPLANMPYIAHDGKPGRAKYFFYAPEGTPNNSYGFKIDGQRVVFVEILSDGKQAVLPPSQHPSDARYTLFNQEMAVPTLTEDEINEMWRALVAVCPDNHEAEAKQACRSAKRAKRQAERQARRAKRTSALPDEGIDYDSFDWDAFTKEVSDNFDLLAYAKANWNGQTQVEANGEIRIFGNGGLLINEDDGTWYCISDQMGCGPFQLVAYNLYSTDDTSGNWGEILREAAEFAGVAWPVFRQPKRAKKQKHWLIPDAPLWVIEFCQNLKLDYAPITLHQVQQTYELGKSYLTQVYDLNHLGAGQWVVQAPTERGKTTAIITQIEDSLIIAVPTQTQVDQIAAEYNLAAIYQSIEPVFTGGVNRFVTTFDSVRKIVARAEKNDIDLSHWTLAIDECHQLASAEFRKKTGIEPLGACIPLFWRSIALSATPPPSVPFFEHAPLIRFTAPQIMKPLYFASCSDYVNGIKQALAQARFVVCHHNDKMAIRAMIEELARDGIKALEFSSDTKGDEHHQNMIYTKNIPECDVLFVTSLYDDGLNFFCSQSYILLITAKSFCAPEQIEQISARIRKQRPLKTILIRKVARSDKTSDIPLAAKYQNFDYAATLNRKLASAVELAAVENEAYRKRMSILQRRDPTALEEELITLARRQLASDGAYLGLKWDDIQYIPDRLGIHMTTYTEWGYACNANRDLMLRALKSYNFVYHGEWQVKELKSATRESKKRQALTRKELTEEKQLEVKGYLEQIQDFGHAEWIVTNKGNEGHNSTEYHAATLMMQLVDTGVTADCAKTLILNSSLTGHAVTIIKSKIRLQQMRLGFEQVGRYLGADVGFYRKLYQIAQIGDLLTGEKLDEIFERILADNEGIAPRIAYCSPNADKQKSKRIWLINRAFGTKRTKVNVEYIDDEDNIKSKRVDFYQIVSLSPLELDFDIEPKIETANAAVATSIAATDSTTATDSTNATDSFVQQTLELAPVAQKLETVYNTEFCATVNENQEGNYDEASHELGRLEAKVDKFEYQPTQSNPYGW